MKIGAFTSPIARATGFSSRLLWVLFVLNLLLPLSHDVLAQEPASSKPPFSLVISLPRHVIGMDLELPLEVTLTNVSDRNPEFYPWDGPRPWFADCSVDVRDSQGRPAKMRPLKEFSRRALMPYSTTANLSITRRSGEKLQVEILLSRFYNLSTPGRYTIQAQRRDDSGVVAKSNTITVYLGEGIRSGRADKSSFSLALRLGPRCLEGDKSLYVAVAIKNISKRDIRVALWRSETRNGMSVDNDDEFASGLEIVDAQGRPAPLNKRGQDLFQYDDVPAGRFSIVQLRSGQTAEKTMQISLYDLSVPGKYTVQIVLTEPATNRQVKSNAIAVTVTGSV